MMTKYWRYFLLWVPILLFTACSGQAVNKSDTFRFGVILVGPQNDKGWSQSHAEAANYVAKLENATPIIIESHNAKDKPGVTLEQTVTHLVNVEGVKLIFITSEEFSLETVRLAQKFPKVVFIGISGDDVLTGSAPPNLGNLMGQMEYMKAVSGCAAALATQTGKLGYLGPLINTETRRLAAATYLGAKLCAETYRADLSQPIGFSVTWIGYWFHNPGFTLDPTLETQKMYDNGIDVVLSGIDTPEVIQVANENVLKGREVWAVPFDYRDACAVAPDYCLGVPFYSWNPSYLKTVRAVRDGTWKQSWEWAPPDWDALSDVTRTNVGWQDGNALTVAQKQNLYDFIGALKAGTMQLWAGPLLLQDGTEYVPAGQVATSPQIWYLPKLLLGMDGTG
ncbi:MAG TPA: BMP family ABC transporter substrate-binding protein [Anaerolineales bacterium]|nr:BMP family ABC transporter substrate-binding protein [Anaerolineales bacterium]